jgi:hypothetical protein
VSKLLIDTVVATNFVKVYNVLKIPTYQNVCFCKCRHCWQSARLVCPTALAVAGLISKLSRFRCYYFHCRTKTVGSAATGQEAIETTRRMLQLQPSIGIIAITMHSDESYMEEMMKAGARGYLLKDAEQDRIIRTIKDVYGQGTGFDPQCTAVLTNFINGNCSGCKLNEAQKEVMRLIGEGYKSSEMTRMLNRGIDSVEGIRKGLYKAAE